MLISYLNVYLNFRIIKSFFVQKIAYWAESCTKYLTHSFLMNVLDSYFIDHHNPEPRSVFISSTIRNSVLIYVLQKCFLNRTLQWLVNNLLSVKYILRSHLSERLLVSETWSWWTASSQWVSLNHLYRIAYHFASLITNS